MDYDLLVRTLNNTETAGKIIENIDRESVDVYLFIQSEFNKGDISTNYPFQFVFRLFYGMEGVGLTKEFKKRYFELLNTRETDLRKILMGFMQSQKKVQLSFATKLLHTVDNNQPLYDGNVRIALGLKQPKAGDIESYVSTYEKLKEYTSKLLSEDMNIVKEFRNHFKVGIEKISDCKVMDFILWSLGENIKR